MEENSKLSTQETKMENIENKKNTENHDEKINIESNFRQSLNQFENLKIDEILGSLVENPSQESAEEIEKNESQNSKNALNNIQNLNHNNLERNPDQIDVQRNDSKQVSMLIKTHNKNEAINYENLFRQNGDSPKKKLKHSVSIEDLKNDENILAKSTLAQKDEFLKLEELDYTENFEIIEMNRQDLYKLFGTIKKCDFYQSKNDDYIPNIGPISTLEYMVESTFGFDRNLIDPISEHIISLEKYLFRWRSVLGDGNCFYRAIIFGFIEKNIFEKNVMLLKQIACEINEKFEESNLRSLESQIRSEITSINKQLILKIFCLIIEILEQEDPESVSKAYEIFLKSFLFCNTFDKGMIMYFRIIIYDYIKNNRTKFYTKDFPVKIGNLLPSQYETEYGDFLYDKFFSEQLLKMETDAEKIVIYLTPFVLKIDLAILIYEFDNDSSVLLKEFPCFLKDKPRINLLYRKTHYDLIYSKHIFENAANALCCYVNLNENLKVTNSKYLEQMRQIKDPDNNIKMSAVSKDYEDINKNPFSTCIACKNSYLHKSNILNVCLNCLNNELSNQMMANYLIFINESQAAYQQGNERFIPQIFNNIFINRQVKIFEKPISINQLAQISEKPLKQLVRDVKSSICVICLANVSQIAEQSKYLSLPCSCLLCCTDCIKTYFDLVFNSEQLEKNGAFCLCGYQYNSLDYKVLYEYFDVNKLKVNQKIVGKFFLESISRNCVGGCMEDYRYGRKDFYTLIIRDPDIAKTYKLKEFRHVICIECFSLSKLKEKQFIECMICNKTHKIEKIKKSINKDEDGCSIL